MKKLLTMGALWALAVLANAGTITVTSPAKGTAANPTLVGSSTSIRVSLTQMVNEAKVGAVIKRQSDNVTIGQISEISVLPDANNKTGTGTLQLTFAQGAAEVVYRVEVRARDINNATAYNADQDLFVKPDLTKPKFLQFNPTSGSFVKGIVPIRVQVRETNLKDWRVQVGGQDIPNNQGDTVDAQGRFIVNWDTTGIQLDGPQTITVRVRDLADNEETQTINVTLDRVPPQVVIRAPQNNARIAPGTTITISVDVTDVSTSSVDVTGVDVVARRTDNSFIVRAARQSWQAVGGNTNRWTGRIRWVAGQLPQTFRLVVTCRDRAGNQSAPQTITLTIG